MRALLLLANEFGKRAWRAACILAICLLLGCSNAHRKSRVLGNGTRLQNSAPESALVHLSNERTDEINLLAAKMSPPESTPFRNHQELNQMYVEWYRKGYAYAFITGVECLRDQVSRHDQPEIERAKVVGWYDGNSAGGLARRLADIDSAFRK